MTRSSSRRPDEVPIERICVGDFVYIQAAMGSAGGAREAARVVRLTTTRHHVTNAVIGWLVELTGGRSVCLRRGAIVERRWARAVAARR